MASLTLKAITKRFGKVPALRGVDLHVEDGTFCVLLGPSGCGKSTLINIVAGLIPQDRGTVLLDDKPVDQLTPRDRDVAMVFQSYALYPHMTVLQNLGFGLRMRGLHKESIRARVAEIAELLGIEDLLDRKPRELSGGQRQRVAMGRALVRRPRVFLLDEPLSNLDARLRANMRLELRRLHQQLRGTVIYVTHDQVEAMTLGEQVVVMKGGKVHQIGSPDAVYSHPKNTFVATFIGSPEINLYRGRVVRTKGRPHFKGPGFSLNLESIQSDLQEGEMELAVRPEDVLVGGEGTLVLQARVEMVTDVGSEKFVHGRLGREGLTIRAPKEDILYPGQDIPVSINPERIHLFRKGRRI